MSQRPGETARQWYARVAAERDAADQRFQAIAADAGSTGSSLIDPADPAQGAAMHRLEELRAEAIEAEAAAVNDPDETA